jgi:hypothetical protein
MPVQRLHRIAVGMIVVALAGCGAKSSEHPNVPVSGSVRVLADGRLATDPPPLTLQDVDREPAGSPARVVLSLLFWAQWGSASSIADAYDAGALNAVGVSNLVGAWESLRGSILNVLPTVVFVRKTSPSEASVGLRLQTASGPPARQLFVLRSTPAGWRVVYDTLLAGALPGYVSEITTANPSTKPTGAAAHLGVEAAAAYRAYWATQAVSAQGQPKATGR